MISNAPHPMLRLNTIDNSISKVTLKNLERLICPNETNMNQSKENRVQNIVEKINKIYKLNENLQRIQSMSTNSKQKIVEFIEKYPKIIIEKMCDNLSIKNNERNNKELMEHKTSFIKRSDTIGKTSKKSNFIFKNLEKK